MGPENPRDRAKSPSPSPPRKTLPSVRGRNLEGGERAGVPGREGAPPPPQRWELVERSFCRDISYICLPSLSPSHSVHRVMISNVAQLLPYF